MSDQIKKLVPEKRFPEFRDSKKWELSQFSEIYNLHSTNSYSRDMLNYENGLVKNIHYGDIHSKFQTLFDITKEIVPFISPSESMGKIKPESYCVEGDLVFADASEDLADVGKSIEIVNLNNERMLSGLHTLLARQIDNKLVIGFGGHLFKSAGIRRQIQKESQGAKVLGISGGRLSGIEVYYPPDKREQQKIADCLTSINNLITAHREKVEALKQQKKGLMQQLFPAEGETVPKFRFPEFENDKEWTCLNLGEICEPITQKVENEKLITVSITAGIGFVSQAEKFSRDISGNQYKNYILLNKGDFSYNKGNSKKFPQGCIYKLKEFDRVAAPNAFISFRFKEGYVGDFFRGYFDQNYHGKQLLKFISSGARSDGLLNISKNDFFSINFPVPREKSEQQKIANCLSKLEELITRQTQKLEDLKAHKKGLMQQLFPSLDEVKA